MKASTTTLVNGETVAVSSTDVKQMVDVMAYMESSAMMLNVYDEMFNNLFVNKGEAYAVAVVDAAADVLLNELIG